MSDRAENNKTVARCPRTLLREINQHHLDSLALLLTPLQPVSFTLGDRVEPEEFSAYGRPPDFPFV